MMPDQQKYTNKLEGSRVLVLGGSAGIGYGVAEAVVENGAKVVISSSNPKRVEEAVARLQQAYPSKAQHIEGFTCDLGSQDVEANLVALLEQVGDAEHIVFTAGDSLAMMPLSELELPKMIKAGQIRFFAPLLLAKHLPKSTVSYTLTTGSVSFKPIKNWSTVAGYGSGLHAVTRNLALDLAPVRVNLVSPGVVDTDLWRGGGIKTEEEVKETLAVAAKGTVTGKPGRVEDVVEGYLAFMKDENVTGSVYSSEGGHLLV